MTVQQPMSQDEMRAELSKIEDGVLAFFNQKAIDVDERWRSIAITHLQQAFMAAKRAIYEGKRVGDP
jgi:hypothetical protein